MQIYLSFQVQMCRVIELWQYFCLDILFETTYFAILIVNAAEKTCFYKRNLRMQNIYLEKCPSPPSI